MSVTHNNASMKSETHNSKVVPTWSHNSVQIFSATKYLYSGTANEGNFKTYACTVNVNLNEYPGYVGTAGTLTKGSSLTYKQTINGYSVVSNAVDLTNYKYLRFTHSSVSESPVAYGNGNHIVFFIAKTIAASAKITTTLSKILKTGKGTASGDVVINVSSLTGNYYIGFMCYTESASNAYTQVSFSNMRLTTT